MWAVSQKCLAPQSSISTLLKNNNVINDMDNRISIISNKIVVIGEIIHQSNRDIVVEIVEPYSGITNFRHISCIAKPSKNYSGDYGIVTAKYLLNQMYKLCKEAEEHASQLKVVLKKWEELNSQINKVTLVNREHRKIVRKKFKCGVINQSQYQQALKELNNISINYNSILTEFFDTNIQPYFSSIIPFSLKKPMIDFIEDCPLSK